MNNFLRIHPLLFATMTAGYGGLIPLGEHVDLRWRWQSNAWIAQAIADSDPENPYDPDHFFLPLSDKPYTAGNPANSGARFSRSRSAAFDFTGVEAGQPLWIAVQGTPGLGEAWPGLENNQPPSTFGTYIPADLRLSQSIPQPYITITLDSYTPPHGKSSHFSMWRTSTNSPPIVWMSTYDTSVVNRYVFTAGSHTHFNWGFTALGIHRVRLKASAFLGPGQSNPTGFSAVETLTFAIGPFASWQATHFSSAELDDVAISGPLADPDRDGLKNLVEFGFGLHPRNGRPVADAVGLGLPQFSVVEEGGIFFEVVNYPARREAAQMAPLSYSPEFSDGLASWSDLGVITTESDFSGLTASLNTVWKKVSSRRAVGPVKPSNGFARVGLAFPEP